jgi:SagB-type dehydrogenase family enzyme
MNPAQPPRAAAIALPEPDTTGVVTLERTLGQRRSVREYSRKPLTPAQVGQLLWAGQGITNRAGDRTTPSAGALNPLELHVVAGEVDDLQPGVYRYRPRKHELLRTADEDRRAALGAASLRQACVRNGTVVIAIAAVVRRTTREYGERGVRYVLMEAGHTVQSIYLQAEALGLGTVVVGAFDDDRIAELLQLPRGEEALALMPVGRKR